MPNHADIHSQTSPRLFKSFKHGEGFVMTKKKKDLGTIIHKIVKGEVQNEEDNEEELEGENEDIVEIPAKRLEELEGTEQSMQIVSKKAFEHERDEVSKAFKKEFGKDPEIKSTEQLEFIKNMVNVKGETEYELDVWGRKMPKHKGIGSTVRLPKQPSGSTDITEQAEKGSKIVSAIYNEYEKLIEKQKMNAFNPEGSKPLTIEEVKRLKVLEAKRNRLMRAVIKGEQERGKITKFTTFKCPICNRQTSGKKCSNCGYVYGKRVTQKAKDEYLLKGA